MGDSRCVLCRNGVAIDMSVDHKPDDDKELKRIQNAGGKVTAEGRVNGGLNLSRAMGKDIHILAFSGILFVTYLAARTPRFTLKPVIILLLYMLFDALSIVKVLLCIIVI